MLKERVINILDTFAREELGNRLSQFALLSLRSMIENEFNRDERENKGKEAQSETIVKQEEVKKQLADTTTNYGWTIPDKWDKDWYDEFVSLMNEIDTELFFVQGGSTSLDHGALNGLTDDDHPLYFMVYGRHNEDLLIRGNLSVSAGSGGSGGNVTILNDLYVAGSIQFDGPLQAMKLWTIADNNGATLAVSDFGTTYTASAASGASVTFTLPSVGSTDVGAWFRFVKLSACTLKVVPSDSDMIADGSAYIDNSETSETYATLTLQLASETRWVITGAHGTWRTV